MENAPDWKQPPQDKEDSGEIDSILGNEKKCESKMSKKIETEEEHSGLAEPQNAARTEQSVSKNPDSSIDLEPDKNLERFYCCKKEKTLGSSHVESQEVDIKKKSYRKKMLQKESVWQK